MQDGQNFRKMVAQKEFEVVRVPYENRAHDYPYIYRAGEQGREFAAAFSQLVWTIGNPTPEQSSPLLVEPPETASDRHLTYAQSIAVPKGSAKWLNAVYQSAILIALDAYKEGKQDGQNLLSQLANGEMAIEDYNKAAITHGSELEEARRDLIKIMLDPKASKKARDDARRLYEVSNQLR